MTITKDQVVERLGEMTVTELIGLTKDLEQKWGVKAEPQVQRAAPPPPPAPEQTEFDLWLLEAGPNKVPVIKAIRDITGLGLKEAKELSEAPTRALMTAVPKAEADAAAAKLTEAGARYELR